MSKREKPGGIVAHEDEELSVRSKDPEEYGGAFFEVTGCQNP